MALGTVICDECKITFQKDKKEINRRIRDSGPNARFFCSPKCAGIGVNRDRVRPILTKLCKCGTYYQTNTDSIYCSRGCASRYSFNDDRRIAFINAGIANRFTSDNLGAIADSLRVREWNKYNDIHEMLFYSSIPHLFEYHLPDTRYIFDLALFDLNLFIEFDEAYHNGAQVIEDQKKTLEANMRGWSVFRINTDKLSVPYPCNLLSQFLSFYD